MVSLNDSGIICKLKSIRNIKKLTQAQLAELVGLKRQGIYDLEAGRYLPNTAVALRLAKILECRVEDIFCEDDGCTADPITLVDCSEKPDPRITVVKVRGKLYGYSLSGKNSMREEMKAADGLLVSGMPRVNMLKSGKELDNTALLLGCDPAFSILGHHVLRSGQGSNLCCRFASSTRAIESLAAGHAHIAGTHMHDTGSINGNLEIVRKSLPGTSGLLVAFSHFEEGLMVARGNPLTIRNPEDLAQDGIRLVNREPGAALRSLLDDCLIKAGVPFEAVKGFDDVVKSHAEGAQRIVHGLADAALGLRAISEAYGLGFVSISHVRCDLVIPGDLLNHTAVKTILDILQSKALREELRCLPGYDASCTGKVVARL